MVSLNVNAFLKYIWYFRCNLSNYRDLVSDQIQESSSVDPCSYKSLASNSGFIWVSLVNSWNSKLVISNTIFCQRNHAYQIHLLIINSYFFLQRLYWKYFPSSHLKFSWVIMISWVITRIKLFSIHYACYRTIYHPCCLWCLVYGLWQPLLPDLIQLF